MVVKKLSIELLIDYGMTRLFQLAEYVCGVCSFDKSEPIVSQSKEPVPTIRFSDEDKMVEGDLFA